MDPEAAKLPGVTLRDIDYFDTLSKNNEQIRLKELDRARAIMEEDLDGAVKEILFHPYIGRLAELRAAFARRPCAGTSFCWYAGSGWAENFPLRETDRATSRT